MMKDKLADSVGKRFQLHPAPLIEDERGRREIDSVFIVENYCPHCDESEITYENVQDT